MSDLDTGAADAGAAAPTQSLEERIASTMEATYDDVTAASDRGTDGKFTSRQAADNGAGDAAAAGDKPPADKVTDQPQKPASGTGDSSSIAAPESWSAEHKGKWATVPPDVQAYIAQREAEAHKAITQGGEKIKAYEPLDRVLTPFRQHFASQGVTEDQAIGHLLHLAVQADTDFPGFVREQAKARGIDLKTLTSADGGGDAGAYVDPELAALRKEVTDLRTIVHGDKQAQAAQGRAALVNEVQAFAVEPEHSEHWETIADEVMAHIPMLRQAHPTASPREILQKAYDKAVWANPVSRAKLQAAEAKAAEEKRTKEAQEAATKARKAAGTPISQRGAPAGGLKAPPRSIDQTMSEAYDRAHGTA